MEHQQNRPPRKPPGTATPKDRRKPADLRLTFASARAKPPIAPPLAREEDNALVLGLGAIVRKYCDMSLDRKRCQHPPA